jgi:isopenicillin N synthase-like dioxygenase
MSVVQTPSADKQDEPAAPHGHFTHLPLVDVSGLYSENPTERHAAALRLGAAARDAGFCYVIGHRISQVLTQRVVEQAKALFALPLEDKLRYYIGLSKNHRGYVPEGEEVFTGGTRDRKEAFDLGLELPANDPDVLNGTPMLGPNPWPELPRFRDDVAAYYDAVFALGNLLFRGFALALGLREDYFSRSVTKPPSQLRLIHYPYNADAVDTVGIGAHTDYECFTILFPTAPGLEVMNGAGEWIDAPPIEGAFIVNIGDLMEVWTNGEFVATSHRVRRVREERYSFAMFCTCDYHTVIKPLDEFVATDGSRYEPQLAGEHLFAQTAQSFSYLKRRLEAGELILPPSAKPLSSYGQTARQNRVSDFGVVG